MKLWHRDSIEVGDGLTVFWTNDVPLEPGKNGVTCVVKEHPLNTLKERAEKSIADYVKGYAPGFVCTEQ